MSNFDEVGYLTDTYDDVGVDWGYPEPTEEDFRLHPPADALAQVATVEYLCDLCDRAIRVGAVYWIPDDGAPIGQPSESPVHPACWLAEQDVVEGHWR